MAHCCSIGSSTSNPADHGQQADKRSAGVPIDRGWAWVVVAAACGVFGLPAGSSRITGIIYLEMLDHFQSDRQLTFWVFSVRGLVTLCLGSLASLALQKVSHRTAIAAGAVLTSGGMIASAFVPVMEITFFTYGVMYGFGTALLHVAALTCTAQYFDRHRGLAVGLTTAGAGVFAFSMPQIARFLFDNFTFEGAMLICGGIFLNLFVCALLVRPISMYQPRKRKVAANDAASTRSDSCNGTDPGSLTKERDKMAAEESYMLSLADVGMSSTIQLPATHTVDSRSANDVKMAASECTGSSSGRKAVVRMLLKSERMWIICAIQFFASNGFMIIFTAMPPYGDSIGVSRQATSTLLAIGGAFEIVCRALHGWLSDRKLMPPLLQLGLCSGLMGMTALLGPLIGGEASLGILAAACGIVGTPIFTLSTVCMRDLLGAEKMVSAMGIQMAPQAISSVVSTYVMAYLTELTGSWHEVFYYIGANLLITSVIATAYCLRLRCQQQRSSS